MVQLKEVGGWVVWWYHGGGVEMVCCYIPSQPVHGGTMVVELKWYVGIFLPNQFMVVYDGGVVEMVWWYISSQPVHGGV